MTKKDFSAAVAHNRLLRRVPALADVAFVGGGERAERVAGDVARVDVVDTRCNAAGAITLVRDEVGAWTVAADEWGEGDRVLTLERLMERYGYSDADLTCASQVTAPESGAPDAVAATANVKEQRSYAYYNNKADLCEAALAHVFE